MPRSQRTGDLIYNPEIEKEARRLAKEKRVERGQTSNPHGDPEVETASLSDIEPDSSPDPRQEIPETPPLQQNPPIIEPIAMADGGEVPERTLSGKQAGESSSKKKPREEEEEIEVIPVEVPIIKNDAQAGVPKKAAPLVTPIVTQPPFPSRLSTSKKNMEEKEILDTFRKVEVNIPLLDAIKQIPRYAKKLPPKCKDPGMFTVPCKIGDVTFSSAMLDLGASINFMHYSVYESLNVGPLSETGVIISLADKSSVFPRGVLEDVLVQVNQLVFPADFYVIDLDEQVSSKSALILLGRPFLKTARTKIDVYAGSLTMEFDELFELSNGDMLKMILSKGFDCGKLAEQLKLYSLDPEVEKLVSKMEMKKFTRLDVKQIELPPTHTKLPPSLVQPPELELKVLPQHLKYAYLGKNETLPVIISTHLTEFEEEQLLKVLKEHKEAMGWTIADIKGLSPSTCMHKILMEDECKPSRDAQRRLNPPMMEVKTGITVVENNKGMMVPTRVQNGWRVCIDYRKLNASTRKDHFPLPFIDQMLERLAGKSHYCCLDGYSGFHQIPVAPEDQEKTTFTCPFGTFAYRRMPFGLCNAPATFQRCMVSIFSEYVENIIEVFMDDFTVYGNSFQECLTNLTKILKRCIETNLVLNFEKCHFMVSQGLILGHIVSKKGIEVDKAKIDVIQSLPYPTCVREVRSFLGHAGFYRRFIKDFSKITRPMCQLLQKEVDFEFNEACKEAFDKLKELLTSAPIMQAPNWDLPFEIMCDASNYAIGAVLGQKNGRASHVIYYASRTLDNAQSNYSTTEKELLAIVFALEKFRQYLLGTKVIVYSDHAALKYLMTKKDAKPRLIRWILLLQEFDLEIRDKSGCENLVADHLSRIISNETPLPLRDEFPDEHLFSLTQSIPWYADIVNF
ncbi:uncharacterized protein LOC128128892, partial [Lactuca sativa]|uniref:uncharacterized protein LOC128128892 n=1 Tax=Lactuca sativa TaxID=4236 RepID=UPI0022AEE76F